jgi:ribulose-bisphosphate carboxylase small chain
MHVTPQGASSFPPDLDDDQIRRQLAYALGRHWTIAIEHADDPHASNVCWETWGAPVRDTDVARAVDELKACRAAHPDRYVHVVAFDASRGSDTVRLSFLAQRPPVEPAFDLLRERVEGRRVRYTLRPRRAAVSAS